MRTEVEQGSSPNESRGDLPVKNGTRLTALGGVVVAGALALSACGSDNNSSSSSSGASAPAAANKVLIGADLNLLPESPASE